MLDIALAVDSWHLHFGMAFLAAAGTRNYIRALARPVFH